jgi:hypothetical protein
MININALRTKPASRVWVFYHRCFNFVVLFSVQTTPMKVLLVINLIALAIVCFYLFRSRPAAQKVAIAAVDNKKPKRKGK